MPLELWADIFTYEHAASLDWDNELREWQDDCGFGSIHYPTHRGSRYPPMSVCRQMRSAALSCPELWNTICISSSPEHLLASDEVNLAQWLARSGNTTLHILLNGKTQSDRGISKTNVERISALFNVVQQHTHRWISARIDLATNPHAGLSLVNRREGNDLIDCILSNLKYANHLKHLHIGEQLDGYAMEPHVFTISTLRTLAVTTWLDIKESPRFQCRRLTKLSLGSVEVEGDGLVHLSNDLPNLKVLVLPMSWDPSLWNGPFSLPEVMFPHLRVLKILDHELESEAPGMQEVFACIPHVTEVYLATNVVDMDYLSRLPGVHIEDLTFELHNPEDGGYSYDVEVVRRVFYGMPKLRRLRVTGKGTVVSVTPFLRVLAGLNKSSDSKTIPCHVLEGLTLESIPFKLPSLFRFARAHSGEDSNITLCRVTLRNYQGHANIEDADYGTIFQSLNNDASNLLRP